ncbi:class I SAM-dependent methyltransferase [bacterium]|nr:class I SAM-dependent methyltransferase [bacterium]
MSALYDAYASVYDRTGQSRFSLRMVSYARELWELSGHEPQSLLELACGTGSAAVAFANRGLAVTAVDQSEAMLALARAKATRWGAEVRWRCQDIRELALGGTFDAATCFYDSINYLLVPEDLEKAFERVAAHLAPGGLFLFDAITEYAVSTAWGNETEVKVEDAYARIWRASYDPHKRIGALKVDYFVEEADTGLYRRIRETHHHRGYSLFEVREALERAGFDLVNAYDCLTLNAVSASTYRIAYLARRS